MTADLTNPIFKDETAAVAHMEASRWPEGAFCPHCGSLSVRKMGGKTQAGMFLCNDCRDKFTVRTGSIFERSHIPLHKWLLATHLMASSKKGISAHQLHRMLGITYKSAWFMAHRIREAMKPVGVDPLGGEGKTVEADETYIGTKKDQKRGKSGPNHKHSVLALVERGGKTRSFHMPKMGAQDIGEVLTRYASTDSNLNTDEAPIYRPVGKKFAKHESVNHTRDEYVRGETTTNTIEGVFSIFKRGMIGTYHHCGVQHLQRYLNEFDFRYNNRTKLGVSDVGRAARILKGAEGKRLTYRQNTHG